MTPAINIAKKHRIPFNLHEYQHDPSNASYGLEAVEKMAVPKEQVFKTLVVNLDNKELLVGIIPVAGKLSMKCLAKAAKGKKCAMAEKDEVARSTGYVLGGVSPLGQKKRLRTFIDTSAKHHQKIYVSAGRRGLEIELNPMDLAQILTATFADLAP